MVPIFSLHPPPGSTLQQSLQACFVYGSAELNLWERPRSFVALNQRYFSMTTLSERRWTWRGSSSLLNTALSV